MSPPKPKEKPFKSVKKEEQSSEADDSDDSDDFLSSILNTKGRTQTNGSRDARSKSPKVKKEEKDGEETKPSLDARSKFPKVKKEGYDEEETKPSPDSRSKSSKVKKEEKDGEETKLSVTKVVKEKTHMNGTGQVHVKVAKVKKVQTDDKSDKKKKKKKKEDDVKKAGGVVKNDTKQKKAYSLPGQKYDSPEERDPLRIFYETLYTQVPASEMAAFWMMERGLLAAEEAKRTYDRKMKKNQQNKFGSPVKTVTVKRTSIHTSVKKSLVSKSKSVPSKKRKTEDSDSDDDLIFPPKKIKKNKAS